MPCLKEWKHADKIFVKNLIEKEPFYDKIPQKEIRQYAA